VRNVTHEHFFGRRPFFIRTAGVDEKFPIVFYYHIDVHTVRAKIVRFIKKSEPLSSDPFNFVFAIELEFSS